VKWLRIIVLAGLLAALPGCVSGKPGHGLVWRTLSKGLVSGIREERRMVIRNEADFYRLWAEHAAEMPHVALPPDVDFRREMVIFVAMGNRPTGGYSVSVVDAEVRGDRLRVLVALREPRSGTLQIQQETQPYQMIALPAVAAPVRFRRVQEAAKKVEVPERDARPGIEGRLRGRD